MDNFVLLAFPGRGNKLIFNKVKVFFLVTLVDTQVFQLLMVEWIKLGICLFDNAFHVGHKVIVGSGSNSHTISRWAKVNATGISVAIRKSTLFRVLSS